MKEIVDSNWTERTAIVTGASRGLGKAMADALCDAGVHTVYADIGDNPFAAGTQPKNSDFVQIDLREEAAIVDLVHGVGQKHDRVDIIINAAANPGKMIGNMPWARADKFELDVWEDMNRVNLTAPFLMIRESLSWMIKKKWGRIINISSRAARTGMAGGAAYATAKGGLLSLTKLIAYEFSEYNITANSICPGRFPSALADSMPQEMIDASIQAIPLKRVGKHAEIASTALFLASEGAGYITGATIDVNGGAYMG